ncbi:F28K19.19 [Arabidopsis thaliana]|uniref:F28K19.19 n=1 Tax=Arabidopsis thaliana TaxID=3702 RepID=Q9SH03_ARATH|nr:F28K19.19 [Arabidopsis thaliana]
MYILYIMYIKHEKHVLLSNMHMIMRLYPLISFKKIKQIKSGLIVTYAFFYFKKKTLVSINLCDIWEKKHKILI